jgi:hypothetical protein
LLRFAFDAPHALGRIEAAFAGSGIVVTPWPDEETPTPGRVPLWFAVHFSAEHGGYEHLRAGVLRLIDAAGLADEFKPEHVFA